MASTNTMKETLDNVALWILAGLGLLLILWKVFGFNFEAGINFP